MSKSVILIDDENAHSNHIRAALQSASIDVIVAENGYELTSKIYKHDIRVLIFNPNLVWLNALEFILELKRLPYFKDFTIFFIYEKLEKYIEEEAEKLKIICMKYPFHMSHLVDLIKEKLS